MGFLGILATIPSTQRLRAVRAFTSPAKLTLAPVSGFVLLPSSVFQLIEDQLFAIRERLFSFTASELAPGLCITPRWPILTFGFLWPKKALR